MHLRRRQVANTEPEPETTPPTGYRRSKRLAKQPTVTQSHKKDAKVKKPRRKMSQSKSAASDQRRNPKRKAAALPQSHVQPDDLLEEALKPLSTEEIELWDGWIEIESEPAFFDIILRDLGVKDVKVKELFTADQDSLDILPQPVFGLIFLFQYSPFHDDGVAEEEDGPVWFANQTTANACATVALLNIVMNHAGIELGSELEAFHSATVDQNSAIKGYELSNNRFIRKTHNSFARRMDCLNADLFLENESSTVKARKHAPSRSTSRKKKSKKTRGDEYGYHFIAYVPAGGYVWELDGLRTKPRKLGAFDGDCWTTVARPQIEARMFQYEQLSFNLLSICQSPLRAYRQSILVALAAVHFLDQKMQEKQAVAYGDLVSQSDSKLDTSDAALLAEFELKPEDVDIGMASDAAKDRIRQGNFSASEAAAFRCELVTEARATMGEYRSEIISANGDEERVTARKKDYGSALHRWISKLAERGALEEVIKMPS